VGFKGLGKHRAEARFDEVALACVSGLGVTTPGRSNHPRLTSFEGNPLNSQVNHAKYGVDKASISLDHSGVVGFRV